MKRFWTHVTVEPAEAGFTIALDGRPVRTPAKAPCLLPTQALARAVADEWAAQEGEINPATMHFTRAANSAIDRVAREFGAVASIIAAYGETDLICYRAANPEGLVQRQAQAWNPLVEWSAQSLAAPLNLAEGIVHIAQPPDSLSRLTEATHAHSPWEMTALHDLVTISGSLVIGLAVSHGRLDAKTAWTLSRIDEDWNIEEWGADDLAAKTTARREEDFMTAASLLELVRA